MRRYIVEVHGASMAPAYADGGRCTARRASHRSAPPRRGDVVLLRSPERPARVELKRIIGLPHEAVSWRRGRMYVNGAPLSEPYARIHVAPPGDDETRTMRLGPAEYFVAGDHRLYSRDSRQYGPVARAAIVGTIISS